jgi:acyl dehydratase
MKPTQIKYFEDFQIGEKHDFGHYDVDRDEVISFANRYDPQPFHLSDKEAAKTPFGRLAASGWHSCGMLMHMLVNFWQSTPGMQEASLGAIGVDELRWLKPVYPGDTLSVEMEVIEKRESASRPDMGILKTRTTLINQNGEPVMSLVPISMWRRRPAG